MLPYVKNYAHNGSETGVFSQERTIVTINKGDLVRKRRCDFSFGTDRFPDKARWADITHECKSILNKAEEFERPHSSVSMLRDDDSTDYEVLHMYFDGVSSLTKEEARTRNLGDNAINSGFVLNKVRAQLALGIYACGYRMRMGEQDFIVTAVRVDDNRHDFNKRVWVKMIAFKSAKLMLPIPMVGFLPDINAAERISYA